MEKFMLIVFYYALSVILGINCINLGLISPIEVVEEWGCHDTEIRLTCGHLDSKIAILEATFTPNCTNEDCLRLDIKRLARAFITTPKPIVTFSRKSETEAGRKFLEALKNAPDLPDENQDEVVVIDSAETISEVPRGSSESVESNLADLVSEQLNARKATLRASLEKLIIRYLRKLSPDESFDYEMHKRSVERFKRNVRRKRVKRLPKAHSTAVSDGDNELDTNFNDTKADHVLDHNENSEDDDNDDHEDQGDESEKQKSSDSRNGNLRINLGERFIVVNETDPDEREYEERQGGLKETRQFCPEQRRKVSSLDRFDIDRSFKNESIEDYNIRRLLNKKCSGKNHCSFIFSIDHPFSKVWESGTVRIKYVCMDDFRINHYCGEHLDIGYELTPQAQLEQHGSSTTNSAGEPVAEASRVVRESSARDHSSAYHSVKILRSDEGLDALTNLELQKLSIQNGPQSMHQTAGAASSVSDSRKRKIKIHNPVIERSEIKDKGVYSQDFKVMKIIPSNLGDLNDLDKVADQIYIRKDLEEDISSQETNLHTPSPTIPHHGSTSATPHTIAPTIDVITSTQHQSSLPLPKPSFPGAPYLSSEGTTVLYYPAPNYPETPSNRDMDGSRDWLPPDHGDDMNSIHLDNGNASRFVNYTLTIREGPQYVIVFPTTTTAAPPPLHEGVFLPPDNLVYGKDRVKTKNQTAATNETPNLVTTTPTSSPIQSTATTITEHISIISKANASHSNVKSDHPFDHSDRSRNRSNVADDDSTFLFASSTSTANISAISSTMSIDYSSDFNSPTSASNATTITTTDMTSSTSSESSEFGGIFGGISDTELTTATASKHTSSPSVGVDPDDVLQNEIDYSKSTVSSLASSSSMPTAVGTAPSYVNGSLASTTPDSDSNIIKIDLPDSTVYDEDVENGTLDSYEDEGDDDDDYGEDIHDIFPTRSTYTSIQKTVFRKPLLHGFIMTPGYPKFYIGEINCKWEIFAPTGHRIRLSVLDISLRNAEPTCMDYIEVVDKNTSRTLFNSCAEEIRPIEIISDSNQIEVIVKTTTKFAYPKRGVLLHYSALGCVDPPVPADGKLIKKTETTNYYECNKGHIFPDTLSNSRQLVCTERHTWNRILPDCIEQELLIAHSGFIVDRYNINSRKRPPERGENSDQNNEDAINYPPNVHPNYINNNLKSRENNSSIMPDKDADMVFDIIIPTLLIAGLLIVNGFVFAIIIYFRRRNKPLEANAVELAEL